MELSGTATVNIIYGTGEGRVSPEEFFIPEDFAVIR